MQSEWGSGEVVQLIRRPYVTDLSNDTLAVTVASGTMQNSSLKRPRSDISKSEKESLPKVPVASPAVDASECQICFENYTSGGEKRCVVTKCGHIFCFSCIDTVIQNHQPCPKCRKKLGKSSHLYTIYDTTITAVDASQVDKARRMEADERAKRIEVISIYTRDGPQVCVLFCSEKLFHSLFIYDFGRYSVMCSKGLFDIISFHNITCRVMPSS